MTRESKQRERAFSQSASCGRRSLSRARVPLSCVPPAPALLASRAPPAFLHPTLLLISGTCWDYNSSPTGECFSLWQRLALPPSCCHTSCLLLPPSALLSQQKINVRPTAAPELDCRSESLRLTAYKQRTLLPVTETELQTRRLRERTSVLSLCAFLSLFLPLNERERKGRVSVCVYLSLPDSLSLSLVHTRSAVDRKSSSSVGRRCAVCDRLTLQPKGAAFVATMQSWFRAKKERECWCECE